MSAGLLEALDALASAPCYAPAVHKREMRLAGIEDYLFIGGDRLSAGSAAERLGVTPRTVCRWRAALRQAGAQLDAYERWRS